MNLISDMRNVDNMSDSQLFEFLQGLEIPEGYGWVLRRSTSGRGWRLHTSNQLMLKGEPVHTDPRTAIREYIKRELEIIDHINRTGG